MSFNIEEYLNGLPADVTIINVSSKKLTYLPDLTRFRNLQELQCQDNLLTSLPPLNPTLKKLFCNINCLTSLPELNPNLQELSCISNQLTSLPQLNPNLQHLYCDNNQLTDIPSLNLTLQRLCCNNNRLTSLPVLNPKLEILCCSTNPINNIINSGNINVIKKKVQTLYNFRHLYYSLKYKNKFRYLLWVKVREPKIQEYYSPQNLIKLLGGIDESDEEQIDNVLSNW